MGKVRTDTDSIISGQSGRHLEYLDQQHLPGNEPDHPVEGLFALWIKVAYQPLARFTARVLLRYRFTGLCFRLPGVVRDENAILT